MTVDATFGKTASVMLHRPPLDLTVAKTPKMNNLNTQSGADDIIPITPFRERPTEKVPQVHIRT